MPLDVACGLPLNIPLLDPPGIVAGIHSEGFLAKAVSFGLEQTFLDVHKRIWNVAVAQSRVQRISYIYISHIC